MDHLRTLVISSVFIFAQASNAATISFNGYTHDESTNIVVGGGLEWYQWDRTVGLSINDATALLDTIEGGGWAIANNEQVSNLFNTFNFGRVFDADENTYEFTSTGIQEGTESGADLTFISMFGDTYAAAGLSFDYGEGGFEASSALFGDDLDNDSLFNLAQVDDDYSFSNGTIKDGTVRIYDDRWEKNENSQPYGIALVRSVVSVPEPSIIALMIAGLAGIGFFRRRKYQA